MVALTGIATGLFGDFLMWILFGVQHLAFGYHSGELQTAVEHASKVRRVLSLTLGGVFAGVAWYLLRRYLKYDKSEIDDAVWSGDGSLSLRRCFLTSVISEIVIGAGASIGREAAPKLMGGVSAACSRAGRDLLPRNENSSSPVAVARDLPLSTTCRSAVRSSPPKSSVGASPYR